MKNPDMTIEITNYMKNHVEAGGGFAYVGAIHDSFPHALALSQMGYNAFALI